MEQNKDNIKGEWNFSRNDNYVVNFKGRFYGKCTPTDLDWVLEIKNKVLILAEVKRSEKIEGLHLGQKMLAENICKYINPKTIPVYFLYVKGTVVQGEIEIEKSIVKSFYSNINYKWEKRDIKFKDAVDAIIKKHCK